MKRIFYSMALALCALMLSLPAQAVRVSVTTYQELFSAIGQGHSDGYALTEEDIISVEADIYWNASQASYLFVSSNRTRNLDLNGHTLRYTTSDAQYFFAITIKDNSVLNIYDSKGGGKFLCIANSNLATPVQEYDRYRYTNSCLYGVNNCVVNMSEGNNSVLNVYGGTLSAQIGNSTSYDNTSVTYHSPSILMESDLDTQKKFKTNTVNIYGGKLSSILNQYSIPLNDIYIYNNPKFSNEKVTINLYGGELGDANATFPGLTYYKGFKGELKEGTIYGIASTDNLSNFAGIPSTTKVYLNNTQTTASALIGQDLTNSVVRLVGNVELTIAGTTVTKDNASNILGDGRISFDIASNTLYLKKTANEMETLSGNIVYGGFTLNIIVDGKWRLNGRIVGHDGNLVISAAHPDVMVEEKADLLGIHANATPVSLNGKNFTAKHRVAVYIDDNNNYTQSAVSCGMFAINSAWFDAFGKKPVVDCQNSMIQNANIKTGSLNNDVIQIEPQFTQYYIFVQTNGDERGSVTGEGIYNEGTELTISATPKSGYYFDRWYEDGCIDATRTITVTKDATYTALFFPEEVINYYTIDIKTADVKMGLVSGPTGTFEEGTKLTFEAIPASGYQFLYWMDSHEQVVSGSAVLNWTVTADDVLTAHFRVAPPADAYMLWVCGTQVTGSNSADILGDGVWSYDDATRTLTVMKDATYNITNDGFIEDWAGSGTDEPLIVNVGNHKVEAICTTTDNTLRNAIVGTKGMTFTGTTYHGVTLTAQNMYAANFSKPLTVTGHMDLTLNLKNTTDWGKDYFKTAVLLAGVTPSLIVDGANLYINSGVGESAGLGYKVTNKTDQAANLSLNNASIQWGSISDKSLGILDDSPKYEINYLTPALESLCLTSDFGLSFFEGTYINLRAYPAPGYKFVSWSDGNTDNPRLIIMPAHNVYLDPIVEVDDSQIPKGAIINASATEGQGTITNFTSGWYAEGTELTITAQPAEGYEFVEWSDGNTANPYYLTVEDGKNINITALFCEKGQGIENIQVEGDQPQKIMMDGILYIVREGKIYNAQGANVR